MHRSVEGKAKSISVSGDFDDIELKNGELNARENMDEADFLLILRARCNCGSRQRNSLKLFATINPRCVVKARALQSPKEFPSSLFQKHGYDSFESLESMWPVLLQTRQALPISYRLCSLITNPRHYIAYYTQMTEWRRKHP